MKMFYPEQVVIKCRAVTEFASKVKKGTSGDVAKSFKKL